jgi:hypothetical protein
MLAASIRDKAFANTITTNDNDDNDDNDCVCV